MSEAFTQGGVGEVPIKAVLAMTAKAFWTINEKKLAADLYEEKNPGVSVRRDWETPAQHAARVKEREAAFTPTAARIQDMDPARARPELVRQQRFLQGLTVEHPDYEKLFDAAVTQIHMLEDTCGLQRTEYKKGIVPKRKEDVVDEKAKEKLVEYYKRNIDNRRGSITKTVDLNFLELIRDTETLPDLQMLAVQRIEQVKANP